MFTSWPMAYRRFFRQRRLVVDMFHLLGVMFTSHIKYFVFGSGTFVINLHALFSFLIYMVSFDCSLSSAYAQSLILVNHGHFLAHMKDVMDIIFTTHKRRHLYAVWNSLGQLAFRFTRSDGCSQQQDYSYKTVAVTGQFSCILTINRPRFFLFLYLWEYTSRLSYLWHQINVNVKSYSLDALIPREQLPVRIGPQRRSRSGIGK